MTTMTTIARATVTIDIHCKSNWSDETTVAQVKKQAIDDALGVIRKLHADDKYNISVIGEPKITVVTFDSSN